MPDIAVPQIDRQGKDFGVELLLALAIPAQQTLDGEGVAQIVQAGTRLLCLPAQLMTQRGERLAGLPIRQRFGPLVKEKRGGFGPGKGLGASSQIGVQGGSGTASQRHVTGLAPFSLPDRQYRFSRFPIRQLQPESLRDAQSRAGQQTQQRAKGQRIKALWRAELSRCRQQGRLLFRRVDMYGNSPEEKRAKCRTASKRRARRSEFVGGGTCAQLSAHSLVKAPRGPSSWACRGKFFKSTHLTGAQAGVTQQISHCLETGPLLDQMGSESVTQQMRSLAGRPQAGARHTGANALGEPATTHRALAAAGAKDHAGGALLGGTSQIGRQGLSYFFWQGQLPLAPALGSSQAQPTVAPIQVIQTQAGNLPGPQSQSCQAKRYRVVALAQECAAVEALQQPPELPTVQVARQVLPVSAGDGRQRRAQIAGMVSPSAQKATKGPQS